MKMSIILDGKEMTFDEFEQEVRKDERQRVCDYIFYYLKNVRDISDRELVFKDELDLLDHLQQDIYDQLEKGEKSGKTTDNLQ